MCLISEDYVPYLIDYITCEQQPQRLNSTEESVRTVAGAGRVNVADVTWGTRTGVDPTLIRLRAVLTTEVADQ